MAQIIKDNVDFMGLPMNIARGNPIPLDNSAVWYSYEELKIYAKENPVAYVGQILSLVDEENNTATAYVILNTEGDLYSLGSVTLTDNLSIVLNEQHQLSLKDYGVKYYKFIDAVGEETSESYVPAHYEIQLVDEENPWKEGLELRTTIEDNKIILGWFESNLSTIEGISDQVSSLQIAVQDIVKNTYTKNEIDEKITKAIIDSNHLSYKIINTLDEINIEAADAHLYIYLVLQENGTYNEYMVINKQIELLGSWNIDLDNYITIEDLDKKLETKVDKEEGSRLINSEEIEKLSTIEQGAQKNYIENVSDEFIVDDKKTLKLVQLPPNLDISKNQNFINLNSTVLDLNNSINGEQGLKKQFNTLSTTVNDLNSIIKGNESSGTIGLITKVESLDLSINNLNDIVVGTTETPGLQSRVTSIEATITNLSDIYVSKEIYSKEVGDLSKLIRVSGNINSSLVDEVNDINKRLTWNSL